MPGAINNEDYDNIDVSKGIYLAHPMAIPDGFAKQLDNFSIRDGIVQQRSGFRPLATTPLSGNDGYYSLPSNDIVSPIYKLGIDAGGGMRIDAAFFGMYSGGYRFVGLMDNQRIRKSTALTNPPWGSLVVYNGTIYYGATAGVVKLGVTGFPATPPVETVIASSPTNLKQIINHKSRLFGFNINVPNRLYFTDAPAVGTLPETWNPTTNFIDFNGPAGTTSIRSIVSLNNYVYVLTNNGFFSLYTSGAPSNWIVRLVNPDIQIHNYECVVVRNNMIYFLSDTGIYVTDGFDFRLISQQLSEIFSGSLPINLNISKLKAFDGGLMLVSYDINAYGTDVPGVKMYVTKLNQIAWTTFTLREDVSTNGPRQLRMVDSMDMFSINQQDGISYLWLTYNLWNGTTVRAMAYYYKPSLMTARDTHYLAPVEASVPGTFVTPTIGLTLETKELVGSNFMRMKSFREIVLIAGGDFPFTVIFTYARDGRAVEQPDLVGTPTPSIQATNSGAGRYSFPYRTSMGNQLLLSCRIKMIVSLTQETDVVAKENRFLWTLSALGYLAMLQRTMPGDTLGMSTT